jgi:hypothetical protein
MMTNPFLIKTDFKTYTFIDHFLSLIICFIFTDYRDFFHLNSKLSFLEYGELRSISSDKYDKIER